MPLRIALLVAIFVAFSTPVEARSELSEHEVNDLMERLESGTRIGDGWTLDWITHVPHNWRFTLRHDSGEALVLAVSYDRVSPARFRTRYFTITPLASSRFDEALHHLNADLLAPQAERAGTGSDSRGVQRPLPDRALAACWRFLMAVEEGGVPGTAVPWPATPFRAPWTTYGMILGLGLLIGFGAKQALYERSRTTTPKTD